MTHSWQELLKITQGSNLLIEKVKIADKGISIEGNFELPPLISLDLSDQVFVAAFIRCHGSIKEMERLYGVSYPTIKARLTQISEKLGFAAVQTSTSQEQILSRLENGEITVDQALEALK